MQKQVLDQQKKKKKRWLKGCSFGEKSAQLMGKFSSNFLGEILVG